MKSVMHRPSRGTPHDKARKDMNTKTSRAWLLGIAAVLLSTVSTVQAAFAGADHVRWDVVSINPPTDFSLDPGGIAAALANDGSKIVLTSSGSFVAPAGGSGTSSAVTGGGTWETFDAGNVSTGSGTYWVTGLVRWEEAPGAIASPPVTDNIGNAADGRSGLVVLRIAYSDGSQGILVVSCQLPGAPAELFEGVTASKDFVDYFNRVAPVPGVDANRTVFHVLQ